MKRVVIYAAVYGGIGVVIGVLMALYTQDVTTDVLFSANHRNKQAVPTAAPTEVTQNAETTS